MMKNLSFILIIFAFLIFGCGEKHQDLPQEKIPVDSTSTVEENIKVDSESYTGKNEVNVSITRNETNKKYYKGRVVYLTNIFLGNYNPMEKDMMKLLASKGQPIVFMTGEGESAIIYFVLNKDNQPAGKTLADYSDSHQLAIFGKVVMIDDLRILVADKIERVK